MNSLHITGSVWARLHSVELLQRTTKHLSATDKQCTYVHKCQTQLSGRNILFLRKILFCIAIPGEADAQFVKQVDGQEDDHQRKGSPEGVMTADSTSRATMA